MTARPSMPRRRSETKYQTPNTKLQTPNSKEGPSPMHSKNAPRAWLWCLRFGVSLVFGAWCLEFRADAQPTNSIFPIDLPTALQLAGAQNLDVRLVFETNAA